MELLGGSRGRAKLQELAEQVELTEAQEAWLRRRFQRYPEEQAIFRESRRWLALGKRLQSPSPRPGLADRALARARREEEQEIQAQVAARPRWTWSMVTGAMAVSVFVYAVVVQMPDRQVGVASTAGWSQELSPDLVISSEAGPAEARGRFESVVERFGGRVEAREGGLVAELPGSALLELIQSLRELGPLEVENEAGELAREGRIVVRLSFR
ncbi:MAG: hypothetical protein AAGD10_19730 [Myxococcota bacterium]